jgi:hypothetical protein
MKPLVCLALVATLLQGCASVRNVRGKVTATPPPPHAANFFLPPLPDKSLPMRRVAMLPLSGGRFPAEALREVTEAIQGELSRKTLFEVVPVSGADLEAICGQRQLSSVEHIPADVLHALHERLGAEGVLFTDITNFRPYRPIAIGVRAKLVDIGSGAISWACDVVFDSGQPAVAENARKFQRKFSDPNRKLADDGGSVLISPARFAKFAASEAFSSLDSSPSVMH